MDAGTHDPTTPAHRLQRHGDQLPQRRKQDGSIELLWRRLVRATCPNSAQLARKALPFDIAGTRECEYLPPLHACDLGQQVRSSAKPIQAEA